MGVVHVPLFDIFDGGDVGQQRLAHLVVKSLAEVAKDLSIGAVEIGDLIVRLPPEILGVQTIVGVQLLQIVGQFSRREVQCVDEGMRRGQGRVIGAAQDDL